MSMTGLQRPQAQSLLGRFLFSGWDEHEKPVTALSGGERRRLALAVVVASGSNLLVLDEPTNHLDLESREALEAALEAFPGTVLLVSHDRALLDAVADRTVAVEDEALQSYDGGWADLVRTRARESAAAAQDAADRAAAAAAARPAKQKPKRRERPPARPELERVESRIAELERHIGELETKLATDWTDMDTLTAHRAARDELQTLLGRWEELFSADQAAVEAAD
jgi:ATP-binding cassette subfamily F protein 3